MFHRFFLGGGWYYIIVCMCLYFPKFPSRKGIYVDSILFSSAVNIASVKYPRNLLLVYIFLENNWHHSSFWPNCKYHSIPGRNQKYLSCCIAPSKNYPSDNSMEGFSETFCFICIPNNMRFYLVAEFYSPWSLDQDL